MCRYGMIAYKPHFACFNCRKTFKRRLLRDVKEGRSISYKATPAKCPECSSLMANMGLDFESPKKKDVKAWEHIATLYEVGFTFHSCGCSGPGYVPKNAEALKHYFERIKAEYIAQQNFWAQRNTDPSTQSEIAKDQHINGEYIRSLPDDMRIGTRKKPKYDAKAAQFYWNKNSVEIDKKIAIVNSVLSSQNK